MKVFSLFAAGLLALTVGVSSAQAQEKILISGSSAYRTATHTALKALLESTSGFGYGWTGTGAYTGASQAIFTGQIAGHDVIVKTSWSGSVLGIRALVKNDAAVAVNFIPDGTTITSGGTNGLTANSAEIPNIAMSDVAQSATSFISTTLTEATGSPVGILPFVWMASKGAPAALNNITPQIAQLLFGNGDVPLSFFTGNSADALKKVYAIGRNPDSGTRLSAFAESGIGLSDTVVVTQYEPKPTPPATGGVITTLEEWDPETVAGTPFGQGRSGYASGSGVSAALRSTIDAAVNGGNAAYFVSYVGLSDASTAYNGGADAKYLAYNGVDLTNGSGVVDLNKIRSGQYTFWSYEHFLFRPDLDSTKKTIANAISNSIKTTVASGVIQDDAAMTVERQFDGGPVAPK